MLVRMNREPGDVCATQPDIQHEGNRQGSLGVHSARPVFLLWQIIGKGEVVESLILR